MGDVTAQGGGRGDQLPFKRGMKSYRIPSSPFAPGNSLASAGRTGRTGPKSGGGGFCPEAKRCVFGVFGVFGVFLASLISDVTLTALISSPEKVEIPRLSALPEAKR